MTGHKVARICTVGALLVAFALSSFAAGTAGASGVSKPGPPVPGTGVGTKAALAAPNCDDSTGTLKFVSGTAVPCVVPFKAGANNGGATATGVTKDSIKVVVYGKTLDQQTASDLAFKPTNLATGETGTIEAMYKDIAAAFEHTFELYGRKVEFDFVYQTGDDEASQRADAVAVAAKKPFAVLGGGPVFSRAIAAKKIVVISMGTNNEMEAQQPYRESSATDLNIPMVALADLIKKSLNGHPASGAGNADLQKKQRVFGIQYSSGPGSIDIELFKKLLAQAGVKVASVQEFVPPVDAAQLSAQAQEQAITFITKLKSAGVTSVILLNTSYMVTQAVTKAATTQEYSPEWLVSGVGYEDIDLIGRFMDQDQWAHAFGVAANVPSSAKATTNADGTPVDSTAALMTWYWGPNKGTYNIGPLGQLQKLFYGIHMAGPKLTAANMRQGIFAIPASGGALKGQVLNQVVGFGKQLALPFPQYATGGDVSLIWWDPDVTGTSNIVASEGKGMWRYLDGARRYLPGSLPAGEPKFFDTAGTVTEFTTIPASDQQGDRYPCNGCPSSGGASP